MCAGVSGVWRGLSVRIYPYGQYAPLFVSMNHGRCRVLEEEEESMLLSDEAAGILLLAACDPQLGCRWLKKHAVSGSMVMVLDERCWRYLAQLPEFEMMSEPCMQAVWAGAAPEGSQLVLEEAGLSDVQYLKEHYSLADEMGLLTAVRDRRLYAGVVQGRCVGYCGLHPEMGMGMLHVVPGLRLQGYGKALELALIAKTMEKGIVPYAQVFASNRASIALQESLGMAFCPEKICWMRRV